MRTFVDALKERIAPLENPYFRALRDGSLTREEFVETQIQFANAVAFFSRPMAVLAARLPTPDMRLDLLENVSDEHGHGDLRFCHERTFLQLLGRFGVTPDEADRRALWPEVRAFNTILAGLCTLDDRLTGLATLGIIEDLFAGISTEIGASIVKRGWLEEGQLVHYKTHEKLDVAHAEGFYKHLAEPYARDEGLAYQIQQGFELGAYVFLRMYEDLYRARARRWTRVYTGPHSWSAGTGW